MKKFLRKFIKPDVVLKYVDGEPGSMKVLYLDPEASDLSAALGIDAIRKKELNELVVSSYMDSKDMVECAEKFSAKCVHPNELVFATFRMAVMHTGGGNPIAGLMAALNSNKDS